MASIAKHKQGYRAHVCVKGERDSGVFRTKREAEAWASRRETELRAQQKLKPGERHSLAVAFDKYRKEVSPSKRGCRWEEVRIAKFLCDDALPLNVPMAEIDPVMLSAWRDKRLREVSAGSVLREFNLISAVFEMARREWRWITLNPVHDVRKPSAPNGREVVIKWDQVKRMLKALRYSPRGPVRSVSQVVAVCFLLALRTGMRAGELCGLAWNRVHPGYCQLPVTKTVPRDVPLTPKAMRVIEKMCGWDSALVFDLKPATLDSMFRKYRQRAGLSGFTFHDSRHTAATWIASRLKSSGIPAQQAVFDLCKMFGWSRVDQALRYYNPTAAEIALRIA